MKNKIILLVFCILCCSTHTYSIDRDNTERLRDSLTNHYRGDSLKQKVVSFLMDNIKYHASVKGRLLDEYYDKLTGIEERFSYPECLDIIYSLADSTRILGDADYKRVPDIECVSMEYLVENIDHAFNRWKDGHFARHLSFEQFCEYLLPYKLTNENVESWREELYGKYRSCMESIYNIDDKKWSAYWGASQVNDRIKQEKIFIHSIPYIGNVNLPVRVLKNLRMGECSDYTYKTAYIMRACGIPVAIDFTPQWPTRPHSHQWNVVLDNSGKNIPFMGAESNPGYPCKILL